MKEILDRIYQFQDEKYADFSAKLTPTISRDSVIGLRVPNARIIAKEFKNTPIAKEFLKELPHKYFDENMVHSLLVSELKDYDETIEELEKFLPYVDNWAVCDIINPKCFKKNKSRLLEDIKRLVKSKDTYTIRFAIQMLMNLYLDEDFDKSYHEIIIPIKSNEYYVNMMIAWYFATALAKQYESTIGIIENHRLDKWTHNKTIQKAIESYRITDDQKEYLRSLKIC